MSEKDIAWRKFCDGNQEALANHMELIGIAFTAGWLAAKQEAEKA